MRAPLILLICATVAGCAIPGPGRPVAARLNAEQLSVTLADGMICRTPWARGSGRMDACGVNWQVDVEQKPNIFRQLFSGLAGALGMEGAVPPMASVTLTDDRGRSHVFASPPPAPAGSLSDD